PGLDAAAARSEAFIVAHDELRFDLLHCVHGNAYNNEQRGAAEVEVHSQAAGDERWHALEEITQRSGKMVEVNAGNHPLRNKRDEDEIKSTYQRDAIKDFVNVIGGALARTDAGNKAAV